MAVSAKLVSFDFAHSEGRPVPTVADDERLRRFSTVPRTLRKRPLAAPIFAANTAFSRWIARLSKVAIQQNAASPRVADAHGAQPLKVH